MPTQPQGQVLRTLPLSQVLVREGFNPRDDVERAELDRLTQSVREHGLIQPLVVRPAEGGYELVDGERRYRACAQPAVTEVPVVRETDADRGPRRRRSSLGDRRVLVRVEGCAPAPPRRSWRMRACRSS